VATFKADYCTERRKAELNMAEKSNKGSGVTRLIILIAAAAGCIGAHLIAFPIFVHLAEPLLEPPHLQDSSAEITGWCAISVIAPVGILFGWIAGKRLLSFLDEPSRGKSWPMQPRVLGAALTAMLASALVTTVCLMLLTPLFYGFIDGLVCC
jgi:hypothetical protein